MNNDFALYAQIIVTAVCAVAYVWTYRYQSKKLDVMQKTVDTLAKHIDSQSKIISDFEKYKALFDIDDFEKRLKLKLDNQKEELNLQFRVKAKDISEKAVLSAANSFEKNQGPFLMAWQELAQIAIGMAMQKFPSKENKEERDKYINEYYPHNSVYFIGFCDAYLEGKIPPSDQKK